MYQVVQDAGLDWLDTPSKAVVWSVALGLAGRVEDVLGRTMADSEAAGARTGFLPLWYRGPDGGGFAGGMAGAGGGGLFASSGIPATAGAVSAPRPLGH